MVWAALTFTTKLPRPADTAVVFRVVRVSGTIRKAEEEVIRRAKGIVRRAREGTGGKDEIMEGLVRAVEKRAEPEGVLAVVDGGEESESGSESEES
jgi:ribonuclease P/MRP protein subunit POP5